MLKNSVKNYIKKITIISFVLLFFLIPLTSFAETTESKDVEFDQSITIGKSNFSGGIEANSLGLYLESIYKYAIGVVGILATVVMMFGGVLWITAGGNNSRVSDAKAWIGASVTGLVLALSSYTILYLVNPNTLTFRPITLKSPEELEEINNCAKCKSTTEDEACTKNSCCEWLADSCKPKYDYECGDVEGITTICKNPPGCIDAMKENPYEASCPGSQICCETKYSTKEYCGETNNGICQKIVYSSFIGLAECPSGWSEISGDKKCASGFLCCQPK